MKMFVKVFKGLCPLDVTGFPLQCLIFFLQKPNVSGEGVGKKIEPTYFIHTVLNTNKTSTYYILSKTFISISNI